MKEPDPNSVTRSISQALPDANGVTRTIATGAMADALITRTQIGGETLTIGPPPNEVPGYEIQQELGRGGMGVVYLARQVGLNRNVALKMVLSGGHASATERVRFLAEAEAVASVQHPGVVQVFDYGTHSGQPFFAMEFCPGGSLASKLEGTPLKAKESAEIVIKIAKAMQAAHDKGIIHRDLKPSNILISEDGSPKVTDFGLARKTESGSGLTQTGAVLGSPSYMSPEQAEGKQELVGIASDVYSLGAILYECLTGRPPFKAATPLDTVMQVIKDDPVLPSRLAARIPRDLDTIAMKCLAKEPGKRYPSALALAEDLQRHLQGEPILARPATVFEKYWKSLKRRPVLHGLIILTAISIGVSIGVLNASNRNLRNKQEELEKETEAANQAKADAEKQRVLAQSRLEKAVEAVETVMVRVAGEKWAAKPELQNERREVLEEAVRFFNSLGSVESKDPIVRKQTARANLYTAVAYLSLGDYENCISSSETAAALYKTLAEENPKDCSYLRGYAESVSMIGNVYAIKAKFTEALTNYEVAVVIAKKAIAIDPEDDDNQILLADCHSSLALFYSFQRPDLSIKNHTIAYEIGKKLCAKPSPTYKARLVFAMAAINIGVSLKDDSAKKDKFEECKKQMLILEKINPPTARASETFISLKTGYLVHHGMYLFRNKQVDKGMAEAKEGIDLIKSILSVQTKSFPLQIQSIQHQLFFVDMLIKRNEFTKAKQLITEIEKEQEAILSKIPQLSWIKGLGQMQQSLLLIEKVKHTHDATFIDDCESILQNASRGSSNIGSIIYNVACVYAQAIAKAPDSEKERYAAKAMAYLNDLLNNPTFFKDKVNVDHLDKDTDLDPLRKRDDFQTFVNKARAVLIK